MSRLSPASPRHDPYWDVDGSGARRSRHQRRFVRWGVMAVAILVLAVLATRLPAIDPSVLASPAGKPILAGALLSLLVASILLAIARIRYVSRN
ncbi:MAG: hypothetical protein QOI09_2550 [Chloroflexota bacterium]|nr:hypothetical protein [Chloroflexota bacterium]